MVDYSLSLEGRILILSDFNEETFRFDSETVYLSNLRGPNNVQFYTDKEGKTWIYFALTEGLFRAPYQDGDISPSTKPELVTSFINHQTPGVSDKVWHITRTILFHEDKLYVSIGSGCNSCEQPSDEERALVLVMDPDGSNKRFYVDGLRNAVGMIWVDDHLFVTGNGVDHLGAEAPDEMMYRLEEGRNYGWPYCYESKGVVLRDDSQEWQNQNFSCDEVPLTFAAFDPRSAPLGLEYFDDHSNPVLRNSFLVALQGSFIPAIGNGYQVVRVSKDGKQSVFIDGFIKSDERRIGRPVHVLKKDENSFFVVDDFLGKIYYVYSDV
jgi:glucose/arabinose dehydrogenase